MGKARQGDRESDDKAWGEKLKAWKLKAGFDKMSDSDKDAFMERAMATYKNAYQRKERYGNEDYDQRKKAGYFDKMKQGAREVFDEALSKFKKFRQGENDKFDKSMAE